MKLTIAALSITLLSIADAQRLSSSRPNIPVNNRICDYQSNGYFFSALRTYGGDSRSYCQSVGADLVSVTNSNFADLTQMIVKCLGPGRKAWINSWDGNTFGNSPLAIWTGLQSGSGSININIDNEPLFAICSNVNQGHQSPKNLPGYQNLRSEGVVVNDDLSSISNEDTAGTTTDFLDLLRPTGLPVDGGVGEAPLFTPLLENVDEIVENAVKSAFEEVMADAVEADDEAPDSDYVLNSVEDVKNDESDEVDKTDKDNEIKEDDEAGEENGIVDIGGVDINDEAVAGDEVEEDNSAANGKKESNEAVLNENAINQENILFDIPQLFEQNFNSMN